jgi:16S rRNA G1207 methylase RsmC
MIVSKSKGSDFFDYAAIQANITFDNTMQIVDFGAGAGLITANCG